MSFTIVIVFVNLCFVCFFSFYILINSNSLFLLFSLDESRFYWGVEGVMNGFITFIRVLSISRWWKSTQGKKCIIIMTSSITVRFTYFLKETPFSSIYSSWSDIYIAFHLVLHQWCLEATWMFRKETWSQVMRKSKIKSSNIWILMKMKYAYSFWLINQPNLTLEYWSKESALLISFLVRKF